MELKIFKGYVPFVIAILKNILTGDPFSRRILLDNRIMPKDAWRSLEMLGKHKDFLKKNDYEVPEDDAPKELAKVLEKLKPLEDYYRKWEPIMKLAFDEIDKEMLKTFIDAGKKFFGTGKGKYEVLIGLSPEDSWNGLCGRFEEHEYVIICGVPINYSRQEKKWRSYKFTSLIAHEIYHGLISESGLREKLKERFGELAYLVEEGIIESLRYTYGAVLELYYPELYRPEDRKNSWYDPSKSFGALLAPYTAEYLKAGKKIDEQFLDICAKLIKKVYKRD